MDSAHRYVDHLLGVNAQVPFAKQPIIVRKIGFEYWKQGLIDGALRNLYAGTPT